MNFHARALRGLRNGCYIPLGYDCSPTDASRLQVNETEADEVRRIFDVFLEEGTLSRAVSKLNQLGLKPKAVKNKHSRLNHKGKWNTQSLQSFLRNLTFIGMREINKCKKDVDQKTLKPVERHQVVKASWPAILDERPFQEAQKILGENLLLARTRLANAESRIFMASGVLRCGECGRALMGTTAHGNSQKYRYYRHRPTSGEPVTCQTKSIRADEFEDRLLQQLDQVLLKEGCLDEVERRIEKISQTRTEAEKGDLTKSMSELAEVEMEMEDAFKLHARTSDVSMDDIFHQRLKKLQDKKKSAEERINLLRAQFQNESSPSEQRKVIENNLNEFKKMRGGANRVIIKRLVRRVVESIVVYPERLALRYWTSSEVTDQNQRQKIKKAPDLSSGAAFLKTFDQRVFGSSIIKNGRASTKLESRRNFR